MAGRKGGFMPATVIEFAASKITRAMATIALVSDKTLDSGKQRFVPEDAEGDHPEKSALRVPITGVKGGFVTVYGPFYADGAAVKGLELFIGASGKPASRKVKAVVTEDHEGVISGQIVEVDGERFLIANGEAIALA